MEVGAPASLKLPELENVVRGSGNPQGEKPGAQHLGLMGKLRKPCGPTDLALFSQSPSSPSLLPRAPPCLKEKREENNDQVPGESVASPFPSALGLRTDPACWEGLCS